VSGRGARASEAELIFADVISAIQGVDTNPAGSPIAPLGLTEE